ncbi:hypothetical protein V6Z11_A10G276100 [Gossypium hirsutum]
MLLSFKIFNFFYSMILALERKHMPLELLLSQNSLNEHMEPGCYFQCQPIEETHINT